MPVQIPSAAHSRHDGPWDGPTLVLILCLTGGTATFAVFAWALPFALVLPLFSVAVIACAGAVAALAWAQPKARPARITYWDIAGALTFIGIVAALLSDPDQVVPLMEARRSD